jgi:hypothetical protein
MCMWVIKEKRYRIMSIMDANHSSCSVTVIIEAELVAALTHLPDLAYAKLWRKLGIRTYLHHRLICM